MPNLVPMPRLAQNTVTFETVALEPVAYEPAAFSPNADLTDANLAVPVRRTAKPRTAAAWLRTLACKWDMAAVIALMLAGAAYGVYALLSLTGF